VRINDTAGGYGWISIALHWLTVAIVLAMLIVGSLSHAGTRGEADPALVHLHTTIGVTAYLLLWGRIVWRFAVGHPGPLPRQGTFTFAVGKYFHYALLLVIAAMLVSGPLMAWSAGDAIHVFGLEIPSPIGKTPALNRAMTSVHGYGATVIFAGVLLHLLGVFKHTAIDRDGTFDKIMIAGGGGQK
jgi:cytochrome b561